MSEYQDTLREELRDAQYRYAYSEDFLNTFIATQIRVLREQRGMTQEQLGLEIGTQQTGVSRYENVNYSAWRTETLRKIARALGVRLRISFEPFGTLLDDAAVFSQESLKRPKFEDDPAFESRDEQPERDKGAAAVFVSHSKTEQPLLNSILNMVSASTPLASISSLSLLGQNHSDPATQLGNRLIFAAGSGKTHLAVDDIVQDQGKSSRPPLVNAILQEPEKAA